MTFRHIEAFRAVVATGSMTEASRRLHTSQPQVSRLIAQLEAITGLPLFDRSGSRVVPSLDGTRFHAEVERAFVGLTSLESAAARIRAFGAERLRVAAMPRLAGGLLARAVVRFRAAHPDVIVAIHSGDDETVNHWLATGSCDAALTMLYGDAPGGARRACRDARLRRRPAAGTRPRRAGIARARGFSGRALRRRVAR
uniref:LysR family transcriptional regulator n=1 Tax=Methylobacterium sp. B34 TaxID=95563 RepID=UPI001FCB6EED